MPPPEGEPPPKPDLPDVTVHVDPDIASGRAPHRIPGHRHDDLPVHSRQPGPCRCGNWTAHAERVNARHMQHHEAQPLPSACMNFGCRMVAAGGLSGGESGMSEVAEETDAGPRKALAG